MKKFKIGDIVKNRNSKIHNEYFLILDMNDFSVEEGDMLVTDIDYELACIYPVTSNEVYMVLNESDIEYMDNIGTVTGKMILDMVENDRKKKGMDYQAGYMEGFKKETIEKDEKKKQQYIRKPLDVVEYHELESIDMCLDALNDLTRLHKMFGDEAYLQLKEVVEKRIKLLS